MGAPVRIDDMLYEEAKVAARGEFRTIAGQLEFWARLGKAALDNPDLPVNFVVELLKARQEPKESLTEFKPQRRG